MATQRLRAFDLDDYPNGMRQFGPFNLRANDREFYFEIRRCTSADLTIWPNASTTVKFDLELSRDGGANWEYGGGFEARGGVHTKIDGSEATITAIKVSLPPGAQRQMRAAITIAGGPLRSEGFAELRDS